MSGNEDRVIYQRPLAYLLGLEEGRTVHDGERLPPQDPNDPPSTWALHAEAIDATNGAWRGKPSSIIWHFHLEGVPAAGFQASRRQSR